MTPIHHLVVLKVRPDATSDDVDGALDAVRRLGTQIDGVEAVSAGPDRSIEGLAGDFTHAIYVRFADQQTRDRYLPHAAHLAVVAQLRPLLDGLVVVDLHAI